MLPRFLVAISKISEISTHPIFRSFLGLEQFEAELARASAALPSNISHMQLETSSIPSTDNSPVLTSIREESGTTSSNSNLRIQSAVNSPFTSTTNTGNLPTSPAVRLEVGHGHPGQEEMEPVISTEETASATMVHPHEYITHPIGPSTTGPSGSITEPFMSTTTTTTSQAKVPAPIHAGDEFQRARTDVDIRIPILTIPVDELINPVKEEINETKSLVHQVEVLESEAEKAQQLAQEKSLEMRMASTHKQAVEEEIHSMENAALAAENNAKQLRERSKQLHKEMYTLEKDEHRRMKEYEDAVARATKLVQDARKLEHEITVKAEQAIHDHDIVVNELRHAEEKMEQYAEREEHRQIFEAAAAAARAKSLVTQAAKQKAEEESMIHAAHTAAMEEAEASALLRLAQERLTKAHERKVMYENQANLYQQSSAEATKEAAISSAQQDAHQKASILSYKQIQNTEKALKAAEEEMEAVHATLLPHTTSSTGPTTTSTTSTTTGSKLPHEDVKIERRKITGIGSSLTTIGPNAAERMNELKEIPTRKGEYTGEKAMHMPTNIPSTSTSPNKQPTAVLSTTTTTTTTKETEVISPKYISTPLPGSVTVTKTTTNSTKTNNKVSTYM